VIATIGALLSGVGGYIAAGIAAVGVIAGGWFAAKKSGAAEQRAATTAKEMNDVAAASKARSGVDALGGAAVDERLRQFQRK